MTALIFLNGLMAINFPAMTTIPKSDREEARRRITPLLPYLTRSDYRAIAAELDNTTAGMVHQVALGNRWTIDIFDALITHGTFNKAKIDDLKGTSAVSAPLTTVDSGAGGAIGKMAENAPKRKRAKKPQPEPATV